MTRRGAGKRGLNQGMCFVRHYSILRKIMMVAERLCIKGVRLNPAGTSKECSACRNIGERFECGSYG